MSTPLETGPVQSVEQRAADWFALRRAGEMTAESQRELEAWLAADPEHRAAFDNLEHYWQALAAVRDDPRVLAMRDGASRAGRWRRLAVGGAAVAACIALAVVGTSALLGPAAPGLLARAFAPGQQSFHTEVGQTTTVVLPDGSAVTLDTDSRIRTRQDGHERFVELEKGRALFRVAHDKTRPFKVLAAGRTVTALGTVFEVRATAEQFEVTLLEGRVRIEAPGKADAKGRATELTPGSQLVARDEKRWSVLETDVAKQTSWTQGRLAFDNEPLSEVVAEMNRYSDKKIVIRDAEVGEAPVLGVFKTGDVDGFVRAVEAYHLAKVGDDDGRQVELTRFD